LHIAQQMPLPLTISCSSKSRLVLPFLVLPFWYLLTRVDPDIFRTSSKTVVCVCVCACVGLVLGLGLVGLGYGEMTFVKRHYYLTFTLLLN